MKKDYEYKTPLLHKEDHILIKTKCAQLDISMVKFFKAIAGLPIEDLKKIVKPQENV